MNKQELADKWHAPKHVIDKMIKNGMIMYSLARNGMNALTLIDISDEAVTRLEKELHIPEDVINSEEACELLGCDYVKLYKYTRGGLNFTRLSYRIKLYSREEVEKWQSQSH